MKAAWYSRNGEAQDVMQVGDLPTPPLGLATTTTGIPTSCLQWTTAVDVSARRPTTACSR